MRGSTRARLFACLLAGLAVSGGAVATPPAAPVAIAVHGGAGTIRRDALGEADEAAIRKDLEAAAKSGHYVLATGGSALDAVAAAVRVLEDSPWFNAGRGAVYDAQGGHSLDAAIMDGSSLRAGAVAGVRRIRNPIDLARAVMEQSPHVLLTGDGAEGFARSLGMTLVHPGYFNTERRQGEWREAQRLEALGQLQAVPEAFRYGTVGAVALDAQGRLAAATSTGGMTNKRWGRVGDAPIIGAGTYADEGCAVSATGHGEYFIRKVVAHDICARARYRSVPVVDAAEVVIRDELRRFGGSGGVIVLSADGRLAMPFNTEGMYRAAIGVDGRLEVAIFR